MNGAEIAVWQKPSKKTLKHSSLIDQMRSYRNQDHRLLNGWKIRPNLRTTKTILQNEQLKSGSLSLVISEGSYTLIY